MMKINISSGLTNINIRTMDHWLQIHRFFCIRCLEYEYFAYMHYQPIYLLSLWIISPHNMYKWTDFMPIAKRSEVWIERTYIPSIIHVSASGSTVKWAIYNDYHLLVSWHALLHCCQMYWRIVTGWCWNWWHFLFSQVGMVKYLQWDGHFYYEYFHNLFIYILCPKKCSHFYFFDNSVKC